ncbi:DNA-directed DNA polymerase [Tanacetum coccineum]
MTRSTIKRLTKPLDEPERELRRLKRVAWRLQQNESLVIAGRNLFDAEASSSNNTGANPSTSPETLHENSHPNPSCFQNPITLPTKQTTRIVDSRDIWLRFFHFSLKGKAAEWLDRIPPTQITTWDQLVSRFLDHFFPVGRTSSHRDLILRFKQGDDKPIKSAWIRFQDLIKQVSHHGIQKWLLVQIFHDNISRDNHDLWDDLSPPMNVSSISEAMQPTLTGHLKRACNQISYLKTPAQKVGLKNPYLIYDYYRGSYEADECKQNDLAEQGNSKHKEKGEDGPEWTIRSRFEDELAKFMLEKKSHTKGIGEMFDQHHKELHEQFSQILSTIRKSETRKPEESTFAITTRSGVSTQDPPFLAPSQSTSDNHTKGATKKEGHEDAEPNIIQEPAPRPSIFYQPSKSSNLPFSSRLKK